MNRRSFLGGLLGAAIPLTMGNVSAAKSQTNWSGRIDDISRERLQRQFGPDCALLEVNRQRSHLVAKLAYRGQPFWLRSMDGRNWRTVTSTPGKSARLLA